MKTPIRSRDVAEAAGTSIEVRREERAARLREEARDAAAYRRELEASGFNPKEALELVMHWQGWRWNDGAP